jgi:hypothetical protein
MSRDWYALRGWGGEWGKDTVSRRYLYSVKPPMCTHYCYDVLLYDSVYGVCMMSAKPSQYAKRSV